MGVSCLKLLICICSTSRMVHLWIFPVEIGWMLHVWNACLVFGMVALCWWWTQFVSRMDGLCQERKVPV